MEGTLKELMTVLNHFDSERKLGKDKLDCLRLILECEECSITIGESGY